MPILYRTRRTAGAMQKERVNKVKMATHYKQALKKATLELYTEKKKIVDGKCMEKSASIIYPEIKAKNNGNTHTISRYINKYNLVGVPPLKPVGNSPLKPRKRASFPTGHLSLFARLLKPL
jgi:hypothetical protein